MIDTHCHIDTERFDKDRDVVINQAIADGVECIIVPAIEPKTFNSLLKVVAGYDCLFNGIGVHPHNSFEVNQQVLTEIEQVAQENDKTVAIGEIGLDYYYDFSPIDIQKKSFADQIAIAKNLHLPIIVHNRESDSDLMQILKQNQDGNLSGVLHCFSGDVEMMLQAVDLGFFVSFTGNITFKNTSQLTEVVRQTPIENLLLETDAPWMAPIPYRGKRNEPKFLKLIAQKISEIKSIPINEVISMTTKNAKKLFNLSILLISLLFVSSTVFAQSRTTVYDDDFEDYSPKEDTYDLYPRTFGFGPTLGTNTIVETYDDGQDISYDGLVAYGFITSYRVLKYLTLAASYHYSKSTQYVEKYKVDPNHHHAIEFSSFISPNPYGRVNFYGILGLSYLINKYGRRIYSDEFPLGRKEYENDNKLAANTGLGFNVNIDLNNAGILCFMLEWKLNFALQKTNLEFDPRIDPKQPNHNRKTDISTFYSIPRLSILWYPKF